MIRERATSSTSATTGAIFRFSGSRTFLDVASRDPLASIRASEVVDHAHDLVLTKTALSPSPRTTGITSTPLPADPGLVPGTTKYRREGASVAPLTASRRRGTPALVLPLALALAVVSGCSNSSSSADGASSATVATVTAPASTTQAVDQTIAQQLTDAVTSYQRVYSSIYLDPRQNLSIVDTVAGGEEAASLRSQAQQLIDKQVTTTGTIAVLRVTVSSVTPSPTAGGATTASVTSCNNVAAVKGTLPDGTSVVDPRRLPQTQAIIQLQNTPSTDPSSWRVTQVRSGATIPCDAS